jgi:hypothetical protein
VTAELAFMLPAVAAMMVLVLSLGGAVLGQISLANAARAGARAAALGKSDAEIVSVAKTAGPGGAEVTVERADGLVTVRCGLVARLPVVGSRALEAVAVAACEVSRGCG